MNNVANLDRSGKIVEEVARAAQYMFLIQIHLVLPAPSDQAGRR